MIYDVIAVGAIIFCLVFIVLALKLLLSPVWLLGWFRGNFGFFAIVLSVLLGLLVMDLYTYSEYQEDATIATMSFEEKAPQRYLAKMVDAEGYESEYMILGDQWQLDARLFTWQPSLAVRGLTPTYRLDRMSGRYISLEQERESERSVHAIRSSTASLDIWQFVYQYQDYIPWLDTSYGSAIYSPMADGALYLVSMSRSGLVARPLNDRAKLAVKSWR